MTQLNAANRMNSNFHIARLLFLHNELSFGITIPAMFTHLLRKTEEAKLSLQI
jgi:hypothetical protein